MIFLSISRSVNRPFGAELSRQLFQSRSPDKPVGSKRHTGLEARRGSETHVGAVDAPMEAGFWRSVRLAGQNFVFRFIGAEFGQAGDHGLSCRDRDASSAL